MLTSVPRVVKGRLRRFAVIGSALLVMFVAAAPAGAIFNGQPAANVLGQANFTTGTNDTNQQGFFSPGGLSYDSTNQRLYVAEEGNHRVLTFDVATVTDNENATDVLGQDGFTTGTSGSTAFKMKEPQEVLFDNATSRLYVADSDNNRVLVHDTSGGLAWTSRTSAADNQWNSVAYGNGLFAAVSASGTGNRVMTSPDGINWTSRTSAADNNWASVVYGKGLFVAVSYSGTGNRVMTSPDGITWTSRTSAADNQWNSVVYGNGLFAAVSGDGTGNRVMTSPDGITWTSRTSAADNQWRSVAYGNGLFAAVSADGTGNRVMTSGSFPLVLGQPDLTTVTAGTTQAKLSYPQGLALDGNRLFVSDTSNHRVVTYDVATVTSGENAVNVFGQPDFTTGTPNTQNAGNGCTTTPNACGLSNPQRIDVRPANDHLFVPDFGNNRVLMFDYSGITNGEAAAQVLGQANFTTNAVATTQAGMNGPRSAHADTTNNRLFVSMTGNERVLVYDVSGISNGMNAAFVLGQPDFTTTGTNLTQSGFSAPADTAYDSANNRLFVTDSPNDRVMVFDLNATAGGGGGGGGCPAPSLSVVDPNGGESYAAGSSAVVLWSSTGCQVSGVRILLSTDGGLTYPTEVTASANAQNGYYSWTVPDKDTAKARLKLELIDLGGAVLVSDVSDEDFSIVGTTLPPPPTSTEPPTPTDPSDPDYSISDDLSLSEGISTAADFCKVNRLIKLSSDNDPATQFDSAVYYCGSNGKRYVFASPEIYATWYASFSGVVVISAEQMAALPVGGNVTYKPGVRMVKIVSDPKSYVVAAGGVLRHVPDEATAKSLFGLQWNTFIVDVDPALFASYRIGEPMPSSF